MAAKRTRLTHKIAIQLHLVAENCTICNSRSRRPIWKLLDRLVDWFRKKSDKIVTKLRFSMLEFYIQKIFLEL
jgi:hypothetical protein